MHLPLIESIKKMLETWNGYTPLARWMREHLRIRNQLITEPLAEFLGTFVISLFAVGASAQYRLMPNESYLMPVFGSVSGLLIAIMAFGGASGAHVNPVVTICLALVGDLAWVKVPYYCIAQMVGAYLGAGVAFAIYEHRLCLEGGQVCIEAVGIFSPLPSSPVHVGMLDQIVTVSILMIFLFGMCDKRNLKVDRSLFGIYFALAVGGIAASFGLNAGAVLNPARDLGPRLMAVTLGHSIEAIFYYKDEPYWLVPLFGPMIGGLLGTLIYLLIVGSHLEDEEEEMRSMDSTEETDWKSMIIVPKIRRSFPPRLISHLSSSHTYPYVSTNYINDNNEICLEEMKRRSVDY